MLVAVFLTAAFAAGAVGVLSQWEQITAFSAPSLVYQGDNATMNVSVWAAGYLEYVAVYGKPAALNNSWKMLCSWPGDYLNGPANFSCTETVTADPGNYTLRASIHTTDRGCGNVTYTPNPGANCGDYEDRTVTVLP